jgi:hypothetical protein
MTDERKFSELLYISPPLGGEQLMLPLDLPPDASVSRWVGDQNTRELAYEIHEDMLDGPIEYDIFETLGGRSQIGMPKVRHTLTWFRFTIVPTIDPRGEFLQVDGWRRRPTCPLKEASFAPRLPA